jgi:hypothetical protein
MDEVGVSLLDGGEGCCRAPPLREVDTVPAGGRVISAAGSYNMDPWAA